MADVTQKSNRGVPTSVDQRDLAEFAAALAKANYLYRRLSTTLGSITHKPHNIPTYGQVKVISPPAEFEDITGEEGIVLGGGKSSSNDYTYTVLVLSKQETYYLPGTSLAFTGTIIRETDIYSGESIRVTVDETTGEGRVVRRSRKRATAS